MLCKGSFPPKKISIKLKFGISCVHMLVNPLIHSPTHTHTPTPTPTPHTSHRQTLGTLQRTLQRIKKSLEGKVTCIAIDQQCMEVSANAVPAVSLVDLYMYMYMYNVSMIQPAENIFSASNHYSTNLS